jgi:hypothetical protein
LLRRISRNIVLSPALIAALGMVVFWLLTAAVIPQHTPDMANRERLSHAAAGTDHVRRNIAHLPGSDIQAIAGLT